MSFRTWRLERAGKRVAAARADESELRRQMFLDPDPEGEIAKRYIQALRKLTRAAAKLRRLQR